MRIGSIGAVVAVALACATGGPACDPVAEDPALDVAHPARSSEVVFESADARMFGLVYEAPGAGPHPTAVVLHGFPGNESNFDLAQAIRRSGWNAVFFHYRGAWGSEGKFGFVHVLEDVAAVIATLRQPEFAARHRIDSMRIALVGHSMGGFAALVSAAELADVDCAASLARVDTLEELFDAAMLKDTHLAAPGSIASAVAKVRERWGTALPLVVECGTLDQVREALACAVPHIMLDNMAVDDMRQAVAETGERAVLEASGGISLENVHEVAHTGVNFGSAGALSHSARALDLSLKVVA